MSYNTQFACYLFNTIKIINSELCLFDQDLATAYILFNSIFKNSENIKKKELWSQSNTQYPVLKTMEFVRYSKQLYLTFENKIPKQLYTQNTKQTIFNKTLF